MTAGELINILEKADSKSDVYVIRNLDLSKGVEVMDVVHQHRAQEISILAIDQK